MTGPSCSSSTSVRSIDSTGVMPLPPLSRTRCSPRCSRRWQDEVAARLGQAQDVTDGGVLDEVAADPTGGGGLDRQLERAVGPVRRPREAEAPLVDDAVDRHADHDVLAGAEAGPGVVRVQGQRDGAGGLVDDGGHLGARLVEDESGVEQLEVAVDAVRRGEPVDEARGEDAPHRGCAVGRGWRSRWRSRLGVLLGRGRWFMREQLFTPYGAGATEEARGTRHTPGPEPPRQPAVRWWKRVGRPGPSCARRTATARTDAHRRVNGCLQFPA